ncbi:MAG: phage terminase large subunit [Selenomonadaceae bacterium]|nr:phage terminase large subunit [Selenomonadaceae bacterium]
MPFCVAIHIMQGKWGEMNDENLIQNSNRSRREVEEIRKKGGIASGKSRQPLASPKRHWVFGGKTSLFFDYLARDDDVYSWQGAQICFIGFDELTHFSENQFFYMLSRNRSMCGVKPCVRATCNPDVDSWVADFISWWIDQDTGYAISERSGKIRYFYRHEGEVIWSDTRQELVEKFKISPKLCKSVTFIASSIYDNKALLDINPGYLANLYGLSVVEKERLLNGNWKIRPAAGLYFKREQTRIVKSVPAKIVAVARAWDLAATEITPNNKNPDRTAGCLMARLQNGQYIILDVKRMAANAATVRATVKSTALTDKAEYNANRIFIPQDPGQAGKEQAQSYVRELAGYHITTHVVSGDKVTRAEPFAAQWQQGNVLLLEGTWNEAFICELEGFPDAVHDDQVDAASDAFKSVANAKSWDWLWS